MNAAVLREMSRALDLIANGKTVEFSWQGESIKAGTNRPDHILTGIRYIVGGGSWQIVENEGSQLG